MRVEGSGKVELGEHGQRGLVGLASGNPWHLLRLTGRGRELLEQEREHL